MQLKVSCKEKKNSMNIQMLLSEMIFRSICSLDHTEAVATIGKHSAHWNIVVHGQGGMEYKEIEEKSR